MKTINRPHRRSVRLKEYDYSQPGEYFVTICTHNHESTLGEIINGEMRLNEIGKIAEKCWKEISRHFMNVQLDEFVVMPNHLHGILTINEPWFEYVQPNTKNTNVGVQNFDPYHKTHINTLYQNRWGQLFVHIRLRLHMNVENADITVSVGSVIFTTASSVAIRN
jgi:hypothetical protein